MKKVDPELGLRTMAHAITRTSDTRVLGLLAEFCGGMPLQDFASKLGISCVRLIELVMMGLGDDPPPDASSSPADSGPAAGDDHHHGPTASECVDEDLDEPRPPPRWRSRILRPEPELDQADVEELGSPCETCGEPVPSLRSKYCSAACYKAASNAGRRRAVVEQTHRLSNVDVAIGRLLWPERPPRPQTRAECIDAARPCPWVGCKHHLYLDVNDGGNLRYTRPGVEPWDMPESCSLDVAERGGETLERVGEIMGYTRERCRQVETKAIAKVPEDVRAEFLEAVREKRAELEQRIDWLAEVLSS